jgi:Tol biopolymer transport system component
MARTGSNAARLVAPLSLARTLARPTIGGQMQITSKGTPMLKRTALLILAAISALALPAAAEAAAGSGGAVVFSRVVTTPAAEAGESAAEGGESAAEAKATPTVEGGLFAARHGRLNQLTENPGDSQPDFSSDGRLIAFVRDGDVYAMRADGSGQHPLTSGPEVDARPQFAPNGHYVVFERRSEAGAPRDLYTVDIAGEGLHALTSSLADEHEATFSPDGRVIAFVSGVALSGGGVADDIYSVRPSGAGFARLTHTGRVDEFSPRYFAGGIAYSRGQSGTGPGAYADVYTMRRNGSRVRPAIRGVGSAAIEDVSPNGHTLLFRRDQGLWVKRLGGGRARKLTEVADNSTTNAVFSSDGLRVAAFVATKEAESLSAIRVKDGRSSQLAAGFGLESGSTAATIGPVIAWQPVR